MKRRAFTLLELLIVLAVLGVISAILWPILARSRESCGPRSSCPANLKQIGLALLQYAQDHSEKCPPIALTSTAPYGWADAIYPYTQSNAILKCPFDRDIRSHGNDSKQRGFTDYWMNANASGLSVQSFNSPEFTILGGEGDDGIDLSNARYNRRFLAQRWMDAHDANSPIKRHNDYLPLLFADGHVKNFRLAQIQADPWLGSRWFRP